MRPPAEVPSWCRAVLAVLAAVALTVLAAPVAAAYPPPEPVTGDVDVHDPSAVTRPDGTYLLAYTGAGIALKTSVERVSFRDAGPAFPGGTPWAHPYNGGGRGLWAPDLSYQDGRYVLYYAASTPGSRRSAIFLATSPTGESGTWTHRGLVVETDPEDDFNAIDPDLLVDTDGRWWLSFGSYWSGIKLVELDPATGLRADDTMHAIADRDGGPIEAPNIVKRGDHYYLFVSFDKCCQGAASTYRVMVGRATSVTGPYLDRAGVPMTDGGGTEILAGEGDVHGPGHQDVLADTDGDVLVYHYYADDGAALLGLNELARDPEGWPYPHD